MKNTLRVTAKILTILNGIGIIILIALLRSRETITSDTTWVYVVYLILGLIGIIIGISVKISGTEVPQDINVRSYRRGFKTVGSALLVYSFSTVIISTFYFFK